MLIKVEVETESWDSRFPDRSDDWDRGDTDGHVTGVVAHQAKFGEREIMGSGGRGVKELPVRPGRRVWAVVAQYSTGDTFGHDGGQAQLLDAFASEAEAEALLAAVETWNKSRTATEGWLQAPLRHEGRDYHTAWTGYFEDLDWLRVFGVVVERAR